MKTFILAFVILGFAACKSTTTNDTPPPAPPVVEKTTTIVHDQAPPATPPAPKQNKVELNLTDSGSGIKVRIP